jgi:hypothetical protein
MKKILLVCVIVLSAYAVMAAPCGLPDQFYGAVQIQGSNAPVGTEIQADITDVYTSQTSTNNMDSYFTTKSGYYGDPIISDKFGVMCTNFGDTVSFKVKINGVWTSTGETAECGCGAETLVNLNVETIPVTDVDQDGYTVAQGDCNDNNANIHPGATDLCNGVNDDCDASTDEDYIVTATSCGVGACARAGQLQCVGGVPTDSCSAGAPASDTNCNNIDDDCNGAVDEDYVPAETYCGVGICLAQGQMVCSAGVLSNNCAPVQPSIEECDGLDNDCNGETDEGGVCVLPDNDQDGYTQETDCNDANANVNPGKAEICNGIDDNCANGVDEGASICSANDITVNSCDNNPDNNAFTKDTYSFMSVCNGVQGCTTAPVDWQSLITHACVIGQCGAVCDDNQDCTMGCQPDGCYDEEYRDYYSTSATCSNCLCTGGSCGYTLPYDDEVCDDGLDNDCDQHTDERCAGLDESCDIDIDCAFGLECADGSCAERIDECNVYYPLELATGWNLIGFPSCEAMSTKEGLESIKGKYGDVFALVGGEWKTYNKAAPQELNTLTTLQPFQGLYIYMNEPGILMV